MKLIVVTDLDGTLLDHRSYSFAAAQPAIDCLRENGVPLVLATSKTAAEVRRIHADLSLGTTPAIVENGAGLLGGNDSAEDYARIRQALAQLDPALSVAFHGFAEMTDKEVADVTGLTVELAALARQRRFSEPGLWDGSEDQLIRFRQALAELGIHARHGGRFLTLSFGCTKADAMAEVRRMLGADKVIALGDAPNDTEMLEAADFGVIVRNDHGASIPGLPGEADGRIRRTQQEGPEGWNHAVLELLKVVGVT